jgi:hypothetical protein
MAAQDFLSQTPLFGSLFDPTQQQTMDQLANNQTLMNGIQTPNLQWKNYTPAAYDPTMATATTIQDNPALQDQQSDVLAKLANLSDTGLSDVDAAGYQNARNLGNNLAQGREGAAMQDAAARGVGGSGLEFAMREMGNQAGAQQAQQAALQQAADSARQRALYTQAYGTDLANTRAQDFSNNAANSSILNQFNMANTNAQNQAQQYNVGNTNQAQLINQQGATGVQQQNFNNALTKTGAQAQANTGMANGFAAQNAANINAQNNNGKMAMSAITAMA